MLFRLPRSPLSAVVLLGLLARAGAAQSPPADSIGVLERGQGSAPGPDRIPALLAEAERSADDPARVLRLTGEALGLLATHPSVPFEVVARTAQSNALQDLARYPAALAEAEQAESLAGPTGVDSLISLAAYHVGLVQWRMARYADALRHMERARTLQAARGNSGALASTLRMMGAIHRSQGDLDTALTLSLASLGVAQAIGDEVMAARAHNLIGLVFWDLGRNEEALAALRRALAIHERVGPPGNLGNTLNNIGLVLQQLNRPKESIPNLTQALRIYRETGDRGGEAATYSNLGWASKALGDTARALAYFQQALRLREEIGDRDGIVRSRGALAELYLDLKQARAAIRMYESGIALADSINDRLDLVDQLPSLARAKASLGDSAGALRAFTRFHDIQSALNDSTAHAQIAEVEARYRTREQERELARAEALAESRRRWLTWLVAGSVLLAGCVAGLGMLYVGRGRAQRALEESESRYRALFQTSVLPTFLVEVGSRRLVDLNEAARGVGGSAAPGTSLEVLEPEWLRRVLGRALANGREHAGFDDRWTDTTGGLRVTEVRATAVTLHGRECRLVTVQDATDLRTQEETRQQEDRMQSIGVLAGGIAHDFNNALTGILGNLTLARDGDPEERTELLDQAEQAVAQARRLTAQLLTFSRGGEPVRRPTRVGPLLRNAVQLAAAGSRMRVELEIPDGLWPANLDEGQFSQVVSNLVINAAQATGEGGRLVVRAAHEDGDAPFIRITFEDNGGGIPDEARERIFDPYFTTKTSGTGLGLTTAFAVCRNHGGALRLLSSTPRGTTFAAWFPAEPGAVVTTTVAEPEVAAGGQRVLVLDDEPLVRTMLRRMLERWGFAVEAVSEGGEAVASYREGLATGQPFDLLIMDLTIPGGMGGRQALAEILKEDPSARAIVASGYSDDPTMAHYQEAGFRAMLAKPFRSHELAAAIRTALNGATPASPPAPPPSRQAAPPSAASS